MRDAIYVDGIVPPAVLTWQEEQTRFAFQNGQATYMRNWPYAYALLQDPSQSKVAGRFAVASMPAGPDGMATAALGGSALAVNAYSEQPEAAYRLIEFLLQPEQMIERARIAGQFPTRPALYKTKALADVLTIPLADALTVIERAVPRPITPVYSQLSEILQIALHRALTRQQEPRGVTDAAAGMRALLAKVSSVRSPTPRRTHNAVWTTPRGCAVRRAWGGRSRCRRSPQSRSSPCFPFCGRSGNRCTCTISACRGSAVPSSAPPIMSKPSPIRGSGARWFTRACS
jgi:hypothetical protein